MNWKKLYRIYREEGLTVRKRGGRKRAIGTRAPLSLPSTANERWSLDFMSDSLEDGHRFRVLNVIDDYSRECLAAVVDTSISGMRVARELDRIAEMRGYPVQVVSDNGTELTSNAMLKWQEDRKVGWHYIAPGKAPLSLSKGLCKTALLRALTAECVRNASTNTCSDQSAKPAT